MAIARSALGQSRRPYPLPRGAAAGVPWWWRSLLGAVGADQRVGTGHAAGERLTSWSPRRQSAARRSPPGAPASGALEERGGAVGRPSPRPRRARRDRRENASGFARARMAMTPSVTADAGDRARSASTPGGRCRREVDLAVASPAPDLAGGACATRHPQQGGSTSATAALVGNLCVRPTAGSVIRSLPELLHDRAAWVCAAGCSPAGR